MIFRSLDIDGDFTFGSGKQNYLTENLAIMKNIETLLKTFYSECFFNQDIGVPWFSLLGQKNTDIVILSLKNRILTCEGVTKVTDILFNLSENRVATISYNVDTIYSTGIGGSMTL
jgi:hypothetical protein